MKILILRMLRKYTGFKLFLIGTLVYYIMALLVDVLFKAFIWTDENVADAFTVKNLLQWFVWAILMAAVMSAVRGRKKQAK